LEGTYRKCPEEYVSFCIMREMGWTMDEFDNQPDDYLELIKLFMNIEGKVKRNGNGK
jgi:hypothetical protein